jgi:hypothetical protein
MINDKKNENFEEKSIDICKEDIKNTKKKTKKEKLKYKKKHKRDKKKKVIIKYI